MSIVRAAGGVVARSEPGSPPEVLVVHRPRYDDWSFPKGKCKNGEADAACALREVEEETGLVCVCLSELPGTSYTDARGRPKHVRYWLMRATGGRLAFEHEVDDARWVQAVVAAELLSYARDVELLKRACVVLS